MYTTGGGIRSSPVVDKNGVIYFASRDFYMYALNATTGSLIWKIFLAFDTYTPASLGEFGALYQGTSGGKVFSIISCPAGFFCSSPFSSATCPVGYACPRGSTSPTACVLGTFLSNASACESCPSGTYSASFNSTSCTPCPPGTFGSAPGLSTPACSGSCAAAPGTYCPAGSTSPTSTLPCPADAYCAGGASAPNYSGLLLNRTYDFSGAYQFFTVPPNVSTLRVHIWGGGGGAGNGITQTAFGGAGAFIEGSLAVTPLEVLRVIVGCGACATTADATGGGGLATYNFGAFAAGGGGRSAVQRCTNASGWCSPSASTLASPAWAEVVTAGGGGAGNYVAGGLRVGRARRPAAAAIARRRRCRLRARAAAES